MELRGLAAEKNHIEEEEEKGGQTNLGEPWPHINDSAVSVEVVCREGYEIIFPDCKKNG